MKKKRIILILTALLFIACATTDVQREGDNVVAGSTLILTESPWTGWSREQPEPTVQLFENLSKGTVIYNSTFYGTVKVAEVTADGIRLSVEGSCFVEPNDNGNIDLAADPIESLTIRYGEEKRLVSQTMDGGVELTISLTIGSADEATDPSAEGKSISDLRSFLEKKAREYFENHEESLLILVKAFLSTNYESITFHTDTVEIWEKGLQPYEISKDELDQDLYLYYSLVDPPFHEIFRATPENDRYATTEFAMIETEYCGVSSTNITWQALLCYGDNLAQTWAIPEYLIEKISDDWILFLNYHEGIMR